MSAGPTQAEPVLAILEEVDAHEDWGVHTRMFDNVDGVAVETVQDVEPILEANKADFNSGGHTSPTGALKKIAEIPLVVYQMWRDMYGIDALDPNHRPAVRRLLNSSDWQHLRTAPGRL